VTEIIRIGVDTSKYIFQLHGVDAAEQPVLRKRLGRKQMLEFFAKLPPTKVGMEACGAAHYWARELIKLGHDVKLLAPQHVKPYVKRNKNDGRDAEGLCEAMSRPTMRFVPVKTAEQQAALMLTGVREQMVARRTQLSNMIRGYAAEFGITAAKGLDKIEPLLTQIANDESVPASARELFVLQGREYGQLQGELKGIEARLKAWHRANPDSRRLAGIPGIGPVGAPGAGHEDAGSARVHLRTAFCSLDRADPERSFHRRQDPARQDHPCRRREAAQHTGGGSDRRDQAGHARPRSSVALAGGPSEAQAAQTRGGGACQQECPHRLEADADGAELRRRTDAGCIRSCRLRDRPVGFVRLAGAGAARGADGRIDRSEVRDIPWDPSAEPRSRG
jgi:transposase